MAVVGEIARAKGVRNLCRETGRGRESLYEAFGSWGNLMLAPLLNP